MKNKAKWLLMLLILPLLCGAGEAETTAEDPRALWSAADAAMEEYAFIDVDSTDEVTMTINGEEITAVMSSRIRGSDLTGSSPAYQMVTTGDQVGEIYYANGRAYANMPYGQYSSPMAAEDFWSFISEGLLTFAEEDFAAVELVSADNGYEIRFSKPSETLVDNIAALMAEGFDEVQDADVSGTMYLHADGSLRETVLEMSMTLLQPSGQGVPVKVYSTQQLLAHDESVTVRLPDKLSYFEECEDIRAYAMLYDALSAFQNAGRAEYQSRIQVNGRFADHSQTSDEVMQTRVERDLFGTDYHYFYEHMNVYIANMMDKEAGEFRQRLVPSYSYALDLSNEGKWLKTRKKAGGEQRTEIDVTEGEARDIMLSDINDFTSAAFIDQYENVTMQQVNGVTELSFQPARELRITLADYALENMLTAGAKRNMMRGFPYERWQFNDCSGLVVLDAKGQIQSLVIVVDFYISDWNNGTVTYTRSVKSLNEPVDFPQEYVAAIDRATNGEEVIW